MTENGRAEDWFDRGKLTFIAVLVVGILVPGISRWALGKAGYPTVGAVVFVIGYATMILVLWYGWIRPIDITGPN